MIVGDSRIIAAQTHRRRPQFVSPDTKGINIALSGPTPINVQGDVSPGSTACGGSMGSPRTCSITIQSIPVGTYNIAVTSYDSDAVAGSFAAAHELASGSISNVVVRVAQVTTASVFVGGLVTAFGNAAYISVPADGSVHAVGFVLNPQDYDNEPITATSATAAYANPISLVLTESGGSGHETLSKNGVNVGTTANLNYSTDSIQVNYDGLGAPGYTGTVAIAASGVATSNISVSPMYVVAASYAAGHTLSFLGAGESSALAITEQSAPATVSYTASANPRCAGVATVGSVTGSGASASAAVSDGSTASASGCVLTIADNVGTTASLAIQVLNTTTNGGLSVPGQFQEFNVPTSGAAPYIVRPGPDGRIWFSENYGNKIGAISTSGQVTEYTGLTGNTPRGVVAGPDGRVWVAETSGKLAAYTTSGFISEYPVTGLPIDITTGSDGRMWYCDAANNKIGVIDTNGNGNTEYITTAGAAPSGCVSGPDGRIWFSETSLSRIGAITISGIYSEYSSGITVGSTNFITPGPDGNMWFTEAASNKIGRITMTGAVTEFPLPAGSGPQGITTGADGNLWYTGQANNTIGKISTTGVVGSQIAVPTSSSVPSSISLGADGRLWFAEYNGNKIAAFTP